MAYSRIEQAYLDSVVDYQFPDPVIEEPQQEQPMMLADSGQVKSDAQGGFGTIGPIPRNRGQEALGYVGELLTKAGVQLDKVGLDIPMLGRITLKDLTVGESGKVLEDMSYGFMPVEGGGNFISGTKRIKPDAALELLNLAPAVGAAAKVTTKGAKALAPKAAEMAEDYLRKTGGILDVAPPGSRPGVVSTRLPTAVKATENPLENNLIIDFEAQKRDPVAFKANMDLIQKYPNFSSKSRLPEKRAEDFITEVKDNLLFLHDAVPEATRQRSKLWYDGARTIVDDWTGKYNVPDQAVSGVLAVLSPQKDWFMNVSLGERVLDIYTTKQGVRWGKEMDATAAEIWNKPQYAPMVDALRGKTFAELNDPGLKAMWLRTYDQAFNPREHRIVTPEGQLTDVRLTDKGVPFKTGWGSLNEIGKAILILDDPSVPNISTNLGQQHKVRNFYNNIYDPTSPQGYVTVDTHAVAAGLLRPLSGNSREVLHNFGSGIVGEGGTANSSITGVQGTYGLYAEAYRRAAAERGLLPREMQSITWEAVRGLFPDRFKTPKNAEVIDNIWVQYRKGKLSLEEARDAVFKQANGINPPEWERAGYSSGLTQEVQPPTNAGELSQPSVSRGSAGNMEQGRRGDSTAGNSTNLNSRSSGMAEELK